MQSVPANKARQSVPAMLIIPFLSIFLAISASYSYADIYKFVDDNGVIHFSNMPKDYSSAPVVREKTAGKAVKAAPACATAVRSKVERAVYKQVEAVHPDGAPVCDDVPYAAIIKEKCEKYDVDASLVKAIIRAESGYNPLAVSPKGAMGLMQLMPSTAADMGVKDSYDPEQNIEGGVRYFKYLLDNFNGDVELSVAAYNCGEGRVIRNGKCVPEIPETKNYVKKVMRFSNNPITGMNFTRPIYKIELKDGTIMFTDNPQSSCAGLSITE